MHTVLRHNHASFPSWCLSATGRSLLAHLTTQAPISAVLMPCYVPEGVILPFRHTGTPIVFYALHADLSPNEEDLFAVLQLHGGPHPLVIGINYFGYPNDFSRIASMVHERDGLLLEDCAHCVGVAVASPYADLVLVSFNKILACVDGAALYSRRPSIQFPGGHKDELPTEAVDYYLRHLFYNKSLANSSDAEESRRLLRASGEAYEGYYRIIRDDFELRRVTTGSMLSVQSSDGWLMAARRYKTAKHWEHALHDVLVRDALSYVAPFAVPIMPPNRNEMRERFLEHGIIASTCIDRWDHIPDDLRFHNERRFRDKHLLLPCSDIPYKTMTDAVRGMLVMQ